MSTRWYPRYVAGNPQLRIFLPDFWLKLVKPPVEQPPNKVWFKSSPRMTELDVRNYLTKIYGIPVVALRSTIKNGKLKRAPGASYMIKEPDFRLSFVTLPAGQKFVFPEIFPQEKIDGEVAEEKRTKEISEKSANEHKERNWDRLDIPSWWNA